MTSAPAGTVLDAFCDSHLPWSITVDHVPSVRTSTVRLGESWMVECSVGRMVGHRDRRELARTETETIALLVIDRGAEVFTQDGAETTVTAGSAVLWDSVRPASCFSAQRLVKRTVFFPRAALASMLPRTASAAGLRTLADTPHLRLLRSWLQASSQHADDVRASSTAGTVALDLLHGALLESPVASTSAPALVFRIKAFLVENLHDPDLDLETAARACSVSLRYLHLLFHDTGETAYEYLRRKRLERAERMLTVGSEPVSTVSAACGFASASAFSRAFRAHFGVSPSELRHRAGPQPCPGSSHAVH